MIDRKKNYLKDQNKKEKINKKYTYKALKLAFKEFMGREKTKFDLKDRAKAVLFLATIIIILQIVVKYMVYLL